MLFIKSVLIILTLWCLLEIIIRIIAEKGIKTDFYGSIHREEAPLLQSRFGLKVVQGDGWFHLGWIADPENEDYLIQTMTDAGDWDTLDETTYGSWLSYDGDGRYRVLSRSRHTGREIMIGEVTIKETLSGSYQTTQELPVIDGEWQYLFKPSESGSYLNDHCLYQDADGDWRIMGITSHSRGDYQQERQFAVGVGKKIPPEGAFQEDTPTAMNDSPAWAPFVLREEDKYHLYWSPHRLHHMTSQDGITWENEEILLEYPFHKFFRDAMIVRVANGQWLMYATGRGCWFSRIDIYQSFDLVHWQYIRPALSSTWGSEKNFVTGSMESPFLIQRDGQFYLSITYNNESFFLSALLLQFQIFLNRKAYNNTLIFHSLSPYDFGVYKGTKRTESLITHLVCHAPVYFQIKGDWFVTTCGWPFAASLTKGEVAYAKLKWKKRGIIV
jgi:hypothetical protein